MNTLASLLVLAALAAPPVETSAVPKTRLYVKTTPPGATVQLGDQVLGKSEGLFLVPPGVGKLVITLDGRADAVRQVELSSGRITRIEVALDAPAEGGAPQGGFGIGPILGPAPAAAVQPAQPATETEAGARLPGEGGGPIAGSATGELGAGAATG
ncbi:MAG TPA: PEGA domain-containing protein, partial [Pirellulaceae bacterium]|nr:PEGA domain-containing protein [Pirellulaceae bacterium]